METGRIWFWSESQQKWRRTGNSLPVAKYRADFPHIEFVVWQEGYDPNVTGYPNTEPEAPVPALEEM